MHGRAKTKQTWPILAMISKLIQGTSRELPMDSSSAASGLSAMCFRAVCIAMAAWLARLSEPSADAV